MANPGSGNGNTWELTHRYDEFAQNPNSVEPGWRELFQDLDAEARSWLESRRSSAASPAPASATPSAAPAGDARSAALDSMRALTLIRAYRIRGHLEAELDPLGLVDVEGHLDLDPQTYGFGEADFDRPILCDGHLGLDTANLREIIRAHKQANDDEDFDLVYQLDSAFHIKLLEISG